MSGFSARELATLKHLYAHLHEKGYHHWKTDQHRLEERWLPEHLRIPRKALDHPWISGCVDYCFDVLDHLMVQSFKCRLVLLLDELAQGHCIVQVVSADHLEAQFFDLRRAALATGQALIGYTFYSASPWNPDPFDPRPWVLLEGDPDQ